MPHRPTRRRSLLLTLAVAVAVGGCALTPAPARPATHSPTASAQATLSSSGAPTDAQSRRPKSKKKKKSAKPAPVATTAAAPRTDTRPNIVLITSDDQRKDDLRWMPITRKLLGDAGVTFTNGLAPHPQCCPARAMMLTGQYAHNNGVYGNYGEHGGFLAFDDSRTIATWLHDAGYSTAMVGKFLNGYSARHGMRPGWDIFNPTIENLYEFYDYTMFNNGNPVHYDNLHNADLVAQKTASYIRQFSAQDKPFFIWSSQVAPHDTHHLPWPIPAKRHRHVLEDVKPPSFEAGAFNEADMTDKPSWVTRGGKTKSKGRLQKMFTKRIQSLQAVDEGVGETIEALKETGQLDNTLIVFVSDNGYMLGEHRLLGKNIPYEEALRIPFLMRGPGIPANTNATEPVGLVDLASTFLDAAQTSANMPVDGVSLLPPARTGSALARDTLLIQGGAGSANRDQAGWLFRGVRTDRYTYATYPGTGETELYDRLEDPDQATNRSGNSRYTAVEADLAARLAALSSCSGSNCQGPLGGIIAPTARTGAKTRR